MASPLLTFSVTVFVSDLSSQAAFPELLSPLIGPFLSLTDPWPSWHLELQPMFQMRFYGCLSESKAG